VKDWAARLTEGGHLILSVPGGRRRFAAADVKAGHFRRYDRSDFPGLLAGAGLAEVQTVCYGFPLGTVLRLVWNALASAEDSTRSKVELTAESGRWLQPPSRAGWITAAVSWPFRLLQRPFFGTELGVGYVVLARRSDQGAAD